MVAGKGARLATSREARQHREGEPWLTVEGTAPRSNSAGTRSRARLLHTERIVELRSGRNVVAVSVPEVLGPLCHVAIDGHELWPAERARPARPPTSRLVACSVKHDSGGGSACPGCDAFACVKRTASCKLFLPSTQKRGSASHEDIHFDRPYAKAHPRTIAG
jgi:hypothetical protein